MEMMLGFHPNRQENGSLPAFRQSGIDFVRVSGNSGIFCIVIPAPDNQFPV
jgi:hypothetical protein